MEADFEICEDPRWSKVKTDVDGKPVLSPPNHATPSGGSEDADIIPKERKAKPRDGVADPSVLRGRLLDALADEKNAPGEGGNTMATLGSGAGGVEEVMD